MNIRTPKRNFGLVRAAWAGLVYAGAVFIVAFITGAARTIALAQMPGASPVIAVMIELPAILLAAWIICGWILKWLDVSQDAGTRTAISVTAFVAIIVAEGALSAAITGRGIEGFAASFAQAETLLGLGGQIVYALFPLMRR